MTHYIHNINPIVIQLGGPLAVRWYGLSYLLGFIAAILLLRRWSKKGEFQVPVPEVSNFVVMLAFFGVFLGGRLGYVLFYSPKLILDFSALNILGFEMPVWGVLKVWEGGMASHGGLVGVILFMLWYAKKHNHSFWDLTDNMACTASLGFAFGRLANFINGELWGRVTTAKWGIIFPQSAKPPLHYDQYTIGQIQSMDLPARHPSQLYQAFAEGFLVFGIMLLLRRTAWGKRSGALSACYLVLYALARIGMEFFREPDSSVYFGWLTKGQLYSTLMILGALVIAWKMKLSQAPSTKH